MSDSGSGNRFGEHEGNVLLVPWPDRSGAHPCGL